jgi:hypothetical protein
MTDSSPCPTAETLALLPDGRASENVRLSVMAHLDRCGRCRSALANAGRYEASSEPLPTIRHDPRTAFRIGIELAALRAAVDDGRRKDAAEAIRVLRSLGGPELFSACWVSLDEAPPKCLAREEFLEEVERLERELSRRVDPMACAFGRWAEESRLAAASRNRRFFLEPCFQNMLAELDDLPLSYPVEVTLRQIREYASVPPSRIDLTSLEGALRTLILLF